MFLDYLLHSFFQFISSVSFEFYRYFSKEWMSFFFEFKLIKWFITCLCWRNYLEFIFYFECVYMNWITLPFILELFNASLYLLIILLSFISWSIFCFFLFSLSGWVLAQAAAWRPFHFSYLIIIIQLFI